MDPWLQPAIGYIRNWIEFQMRTSQQPGCIVAIRASGQGCRRIRLRACQPRHRRKAHATPPVSDRIAFQEFHRGRDHEAARTAQIAAGRSRWAVCEGLAPPGRGNHHRAACFPTARALPAMATTPDSLPTAGPIVSREELLADFKLPPAIEPNTRFKYSNHGFGLIGLVIEAITNEPYRGVDQARDHRCRRPARNQAHMRRLPVAFRSRAATHFGFPWAGVSSFPVTIRAMRLRPPPASSVRQRMSPASSGNWRPMRNAACFRLPAVGRSCADTGATRKRCLKAITALESAAARQPAGSGSATPEDSRAMSPAPFRFPHSNSTITVLTNSADGLGRILARWRHAYPARICGTAARRNGAFATGPENGGAPVAQSISSRSAIACWSPIRMRTIHSWMLRKSRSPAVTPAGSRKRSGAEATASQCAERATRPARSPISGSQAAI